MNLPDVAQAVVALLGTGGFGTGAVMLFRARSTNRKTNADSAEVLSTASTSYAAGVVEDMAVLRKEFDEFAREQRRRDVEQQLRDRAQDRLHLLHSRWDYLAAQQIRDLGGDIADPPPLYLAA
jgi:hypothetical protein